jgi:hypothetical protein
MTDRPRPSDSEYSPVQVLAMCLCRGLSDHLGRSRRTTETSKRDGQQYFVVARINAKSPGLPSSDIAVRIGDMSVPATAIETDPDVPRNVAIVIDAGPDQAKVVSKEKELVVAPINELSDASTTFTIDGAHS